MARDYIVKRWEAVMLIIATVGLIALIGCTIEHATHKHIKVTTKNKPKC